jgi:hypothetical protein
MAGAFGYEKGDNYSVSMACGERVLLPKVREAADDDLIVADGFSCREQIAQCTDRQALHLAQVIQLGLHAGENDSGGPHPESRYMQERKREHAIAITKAAVLAVSLGVIGYLLFRSLCQRRAAAHRDG